MKKFIASLLVTVSIVIFAAGPAAAQFESFTAEAEGKASAVNSSRQYYAGKENYFKLFTKPNKRSGGVDFYASNSGHCDYQFEVSFTELTNARTTAAMPYFRVIGASRENVFLFSVVSKNKNRYRYRYKFKFNIGDPDSAEHEGGFKYLIPFEKGTRVKVQQGYNGEFSHSGWMQYSIDFPVPEGTKVCAARDGVVVLVKSDSNTGGKTREFIKDGNYIAIAHNDGTFSEYVHLKRGGNLVKPGDRVKAGDAIALSGNTGFSTSPHLHFIVVKPVRLGLWSIPVKFLGEDGSAIDLIQGKSYVSAR